MAVPSRLVDAAGRVGGRELAGPLGDVVDAAVAAWLGGAPDLVTPAGTLPTGVAPGRARHPQRHPRLVLGRWDAPTTRPTTRRPRSAAGRALLAAGADAIDVGGESTRPGAEPVPADEELAPRPARGRGARRRRRRSSPIDTVKAEVARAAVAAGASIVNDVSAGSLDPDLLAGRASTSSVPYVLTHLRGEPRTMQDAAALRRTWSREVFDHLALGVRDLVAAGLPGRAHRRRPGHRVRQDASRTTWPCSAPSAT